MEASLPDIPVALRAVHADLQRELDAPICMFGVFDAATQTVNVVWQVHNGEELPGGSFPLGNGFTSQVIRSGQPLLIRDWKSGPRVQVQYATDHMGLPQSSITAPINVDGQVRGVISVQSYEPNAFDDRHLAHLVTMAGKLASVIFGAPLKRQPAAPGQRDETVGELVLDRQGRLVQLNEAARKLLCVDPNSVILGHPVLTSQSGLWPLGTQSLTDELRPLIDKATSGERQSAELRFRDTVWTASAVLSDGQPAGALLQFRQAA
jgi:GAF domain-containing protein